MKGNIIVLVVFSKKFLEAHFVFRKFRYYTFTWRFGLYTNSVLSGCPIPLFSSCSFFLTLGCKFATKNQPIPSTKNTCPLSIHLATMGTFRRDTMAPTDFFPPFFQVKIRGFTITDHHPGGVRRCDTDTPLVFPYGTFPGLHTHASSMLESCGYRNPKAMLKASETFRVFCKINSLQNWCFQAIWVNKIRQIGSWNPNFRVSFMKKNWVATI